MTSNLGSEYLIDGIDANNNITEEATRNVNMLLKTKFKPEFLNRLDEIVMFKPLTKDNMIGIIDIIINRLNKRLQEKQLSIELSDNAKNKIIEDSYDPHYGARPLKRYVQSKIETMLSKTILSSDLKIGDKFYVDVLDGAFTIKIVSQE